MSEDQQIIDEVVAAEGTSDLKKKTKLKGTVTRLELYGAFVDIGTDAPAILHISQLPERVNRVSDLLELGQEIEVWVEKVDQARNQVTVTMQKPLAVEWSDLAEGQTYTGKVVRLENFGAFVDIGAEKEGLVHVSELSHGYVKHPAEVIKVDDEVEVQVLGFSRKKRRINLSMKSLQEKPEPAPSSNYNNNNSNNNYNSSSSSANRGSYDQNVAYEEEVEEEMPTAMEMALRAAMGDSPFKAGRQTARTAKQKKERKAARRAQQEEIIMRTLEMTSISE